MGEKYHIIIIYDGGGKVIYHVNLNYLSRGDNIVPKFPTWTKYMLKSFLMENKMEESVNSTLHHITMRCDNINEKRCKISCRATNQNNKNNT
jgi:hypothetical protein